MMAEVLHSTPRLLLRQTSSEGFRLRRSLLRSQLQTGSSLELSPLFIVSLLFDVCCDWPAQGKLFSYWLPLLFQGGLQIGWTGSDKMTELFHYSFRLLLRKTSSGSLRLRRSLFRSQLRTGSFPRQCLCVLKHQLHVDSFVLDLVIFLSSVCRQRLIK